MASTLQKSPDGTLTLTITLPKEEVNKAWEKELQKAVDNAELPGFRKGKAPRQLVEEKLDKFRLQEDVLRQLLPDAYSKAVEEHKLKPVMSPKVHVEKLDDPSAGSNQADWKFTATTCETPEVNLKDYKDAVKKITAKAKIAVPGKPEQQINMDELVDTLIKSVSITVPQVLLESEVERLLAQLLDEVKSLGLSLDQYLSSTHKTIDQLKKEYEQRATKDVTFEFTLQKIANEEKITVEPKEIDEALAKAKDEKEKQNLQANVYLLATILRQQKTLDYLRNL